MWHFIYYYKYSESGLELVCESLLQQDGDVETLMLPARCFH